MQGADQCEQPARGVEIDVDLPGEPLTQELGALVVQAAPAHVERLDLRGTELLDGGVVALAHQEVVLHDLAEGREGQHDVAQLAIVVGMHAEHQALLEDADMQLVGTGLAAHQREVVLLQKIEQRHGALVLDLGRAARYRFLVQHDIDEAATERHSLSRGG